MNRVELQAEIVELLTSHAGQPVDFVALFMFLNTVAGGHYSEQCGEEELRDALRALLAAHRIEPWRVGDDRPLAVDMEMDPAAKPYYCFRLRQPPAE